MKATDGATVTYDLYQPIEINSVNSKFLLMIFHSLPKEIFLFSICFKQSCRISKLGLNLVNPLGDISDLGKYTAQN